MDRKTKIRGESQTPLTEILLNQGCQTRLVERNVSLREAVDFALILVHTNDGVLGFRQASACHESNISRANSGHTLDSISEQRVLIEETVWRCAQCLCGSQ